MSDHCSPGVHHLQNSTAVVPVRASAVTQLQVPVRRLLLVMRRSPISQHISRIFNNRIIPKKMAKKREKSREGVIDTVVEKSLSKASRMQTLPNYHLDRFETTDDN